MNKITKGIRHKSAPSDPPNDSQRAPLTDATRLEQIKLEINVGLEEYKALRAEIVATLTSSHSTTNLTLTASGILIAGSPFIIQYHAIYLFLLASYCFFLIAWTQLRYVHVAVNISEHISKIIAPNIRCSLAKLSLCRSDGVVDLLMWEEAGQNSHLWAAPLQAARYLFPVFAASASAIGFVINAGQLAGRPWWQKYSMELGGGSTILLLLYTSFLTLKVRSLTK
jgi:hypothetical protein